MDQHIGSAHIVLYARIVVWDRFPQEKSGEKKTSNRAKSPLTGSSRSLLLNHPEHMAQPRALSPSPLLNLPPTSNRRKSLAQRGDVVGDLTPSRRRRTYPGPLPACGRESSAC